MNEVCSISIDGWLNMSAVIIALLSLWGLLWQILRTEGMETGAGIYFSHDKRYISLPYRYKFFYSIESVYAPLVNCRIVDCIYGRCDGLSGVCPEVRRVGILQEGQPRQYFASAPAGVECAIVVRYSETSKIRKRIIERAVMFKVVPCVNDGKLSVTRYWWRWGKFTSMKEKINLKFNKELPLGKWIRMKSSCKSMLPNSSYRIP